MKGNSICVGKEYQAMGGVFVLRCFPQNFYSKEDVEKIFDKAFDEIKRIERKFSEFKESEITKINNNAGVSPTAIDKEMLYLLNESIELSRNTNGVFDITFAGLAAVWREAKAKKKILSTEERLELAKLINYKKIKIDDKKMTVFLSNNRMKISFGGIGKGYAVDRAYKILKEAGLYNFYINGAGDIRVHSSKQAPRLWRIGINNPFSPGKNVGVIQLANGSVATSGSYIQNVSNKDQKLDHHIISPATGRSVDSIVSATVISNKAIHSDTIATIVMNMNEVSALEYLNSNHLFGCLINKDGKTSLSKKALAQFGY